MILPALTEALSPHWRPLKYSLFPPLGLATLAGYLESGDQVRIQDEHVEPLELDDDPELVVLQVYITSANRAYAIADLYRVRGAYVVMGGLHPTSLPDEAAAHADTVCLGPGEDIWPTFLADFRAGTPRARYQSTFRTLDGLPRPRRDLIGSGKYLLPNVVSVSRGCPHACGFCYKEPFYAGGRSFYTRRVDDALAEIASLPGRHLYFMDDHLLADRRFAEALFCGMRGMGRVWQAAGTVQSALQPGLLEAASEAGMRSLFVGLETLNEKSLREQNKLQNVGRSYAEAVRRIHDVGALVNGSFVFGMDHDDPDVFDRTTDWAVSLGIETATFHILTPYPGTELHRRLSTECRILHSDWDLYDTRHAVYRPERMSASELETGYQRAYQRFYRWSSIMAASHTKHTWRERARHLAYTAAWKRSEPLWGAIIRLGLIGSLVPVLEALLDLTVEDKAAMSPALLGAEIGDTAA